MYIHIYCSRTSQDQIIGTGWKCLEIRSEVTEVQFLTMLLADSFPLVMQYSP